MKTTIMRIGVMILFIVTSYMMCGCDSNPGNTGDSGVDLSDKDTTDQPEIAGNDAELEGVNTPDSDSDSADNDNTDKSCGNGICETDKGEDHYNCFWDCEGPKCGDGNCDWYFTEECAECNEDCNKCPEDCACTADKFCFQQDIDSYHRCESNELKEFFQFEGTWLCDITVQPNCYMVSEDMTVEVDVFDWDDDKGARVDGFIPCSDGYINKKGTDFYFLAEATAGTMACDEVKFDLEEMSLEFTTEFEGFINHWKYLKQ